MTDNPEDSLKCIFKVVQPYVAKHHPEELRYFGLLWENFANKVRNSGDNLLALGNQVGRSYLSVLGFAGANNLKLATPFAILTVAAVIQEIQAQFAIPSEHQIRNAIHSCAVQFGASHKQVGQMETGLAKSLFSMFAQLQMGNNPAVHAATQEHMIDINVSATITVAGNRVKLSPQQSVILFYELVRRRCLHWLHGFLIFESWRLSSPENPQRRFDNVASKLNKTLNDCSANLIVQRKIREGRKSGFVELEIPPGSRITGDIEEARSLTEKALHLLEGGQIKQAREIALNSFRKDPGSIRNLIIYFQAAYKDADYNVDETMMPQLWHSLRRSCANLQDAVSAANKLFASNWYEHIVAADEAVKSQIEQELCAVREVMFIADRLYHAWRPPSADEMELEQISRMVKEIRDNPQANSLDVKQLSNMPSISKLLRDVKNTIKSIIRYDGFEQNDGFEQSDLELTISREFIQNICGRGKRPEEYKNLEQLRSNWYRKLRRLCIETVVEDICGIIKEQQALYRDYKSVIAKKKQDVKGMTAEQISSILGGKWKKPKVEEVKIIEGIFAKWNHVINMGSYWHIFLHKSDTQK